MMELVYAGAATRPMAGSRDLRAVRTRRMQVDAFHAALSECDPAAMSAASLAREAGINRTSFYSHFDSPEDDAVHALGGSVRRGSEHRHSDPAGHAVNAAEASRQALQEITGFVWRQRELYRGYWDRAPPLAGKCGPRGLR
jgi:AcrR family transcriptional regulator